MDRENIGNINNEFSYLVEILDVFSVDKICFVSVLIKKIKHEGQG